MMANNFSEYYPRFDQEIPAKEKNLMDQFYSSLYPGKYHSESNLIVSEKCMGKLKDGIAKIDQELMDSSPKIAFFQKSNPRWEEGDELTCIARMTILMPFKFQFKIIYQKLLGKK